MATNSLSKKRKINEKDYSDEQLSEAIEKVRSGEHNPYSASKFYKIPRTTITNHISGKTSSFRVGRPPILNNEQEKLLVDLVNQLADWGYPLEKQDLKNVASHFSKTNGMLLNGKPWVPGDDWFYA